MTQTQPVPTQATPIPTRPVVQAPTYLWSSQMAIKVDPTARGYRYMSRAEQDKLADSIQWLGTVEFNDEVGALGLTGGRYMLFSSGRRPIELETTEVLAALAKPEPINPRGRKPGARGPQRPHSVTMDSHTKEAAQRLGEGNLSRGIRLAVEYVTTQVHPQAFIHWRNVQAGDL